MLLLGESPARSALALLQQWHFPATGSPLSPKAPGTKISTSQPCQRQLLPTKESLSRENADLEPAALQEQWLLT